MRRRYWVRPSVILATISRLLETSLIAKLFSIMSDITDSNFDEEVLKSDIPVLVDFWAPWCGPCKSMLPVIEEVAGEYEGKVKVVKVNVDESSEKPQQFGVMSIPAFFIFKGGEAFDSFTGVQTKDFVAGKLDKALE